MNLGLNCTQLTYTFLLEDTYLNNLPYKYAYYITVSNSLFTIFLLGFYFAELYLMTKH